MQKLKVLEDLTSNKEEYDLLYETDHIFILKGIAPDDNKIFEASSLVDHYQWAFKLRGPDSGPYKVANLKNNHDFFHGYIYGVASNNLTKFEKNALMISLSTGYTFQKLDLYQTKKEMKETLFNSLFEEA